MWPKRKKGKGRATKLKLKAMQPGEQPEDVQDSDEESVAVEPQVESPPDARAQQDDLVSGVWKSKVLSNYKQNPKNSHTLLARIPTGKAAFEAGERQKVELVKEAMVKVVDKMFDNFQNTAYEFNQVTAGTNLELSWIRPHFTQEELSNWHDTTKVTIEVLAGRISTRYWTLAVRGTSTAIETYILPSDKLLGFSTSPSSYPTYLSLVAACDGLAVDWLVAKKPLDPETLPNVYRALLDGLIRFASEEALPGETFRLEDIGIVPESESEKREAVGYQSQEQYELLGQSSSRNVIVSVPMTSSADRFIDNISNQVAQAAQSETDKFRQSLQAPPFGTSTRSPESRTDQSGEIQRYDSGPPQEVQADNRSQSQDDDDGGQWKSVASDQVVKADWRKFMETTKEQIKSAPPAKDDNWNTVPGTEKLARSESRAHFDQVQATAQMSSSQVMSGVPYPSYGNASDPPELLKPDNDLPPKSEQSGSYPLQSSLEQSGSYAGNSASYPSNSGSPSGVNSTQSGVNSTQYGQQQGSYPPQGISQSGAYSTQQSGVFSGQQPQLPPQMMPPGYSPQLGQVPQQIPPTMQPGMINHPGLPSMPGMINPALGQSGVHQQPQIPQVPLQGMITPPPGMVPTTPPTPPQGMSPAAPGVPSPMAPGSMRLDDVAAQYAEQKRAALQAQYNTGAQPAMPAQYDTGRQQAIPPPAQYDTGRQPAVPPPQYDTGRQQALLQQFSTGSQQQYNTGGPPTQPFPGSQAQFNSGGQPTQPPQFNTGSQPAVPPPSVPPPSVPPPSVPPPYNVGAQQSPGQYSTDGHLQLQYAQGGYDDQLNQASGDAEVSTASGDEQSQYYVAPYLLADSEGYEQEEHQTESYEYPSEEQSEEWQSEEEVSSEEVEEASLDEAEPTWEEPGNSPFAQSSFPQESFNELPVMSSETMQKFEAASKAGFVFSSENDLVDAINVVLGTIDSQIELLSQQGTEAFQRRDFRRAESIIKLSERLTSFKVESQAILQLMSDADQQQQ